MITERDKILIECISAICWRCAKGDPLYGGDHYSIATIDLGPTVGKKHERYNYRECPANPIRNLMEKTMTVTDETQVANEINHCPQCGSQIRGVRLCLLCGTAHDPGVRKREHDKQTCPDAWHHEASL